jgi:ABC-type transport system involved in multi-copper enzyme maturation permease subunit
MLFKDLPIDPMIYVAILSIIFKLIMMIAVILFFSTFTAPLIALCTSVGVYLIGHSGSDLIAMGMRTGNHFVAYIGEFIKVFFPNMEALSLPKYALNSSLELGSTQIIISLGIAMIYTFLLLAGASWIFNRKNFERF